MAGKFTYPGGDLEIGLGVDDYNLIDQYVGGSLWMWGGNNTWGQLGTNNTTLYSSPVQTIAGGINWKQVSGSRGHSAAIKTDGTLWVWGLNASGQLGTNNATYYSSPIQTVSGGTNWKQVECGQSFTATIKTDGTLWTWGNNDYGQLGTNDTTWRSSPVQTVAGGNNWKQVSARRDGIMAIKTDGTLWGWGYNTGSLGTNNRIWYSSPVQTVAAGNNWKQVSAGGDTAGAIKTDGTLWMWGSNSFGELGDGTTASKSSPVQTIAGGNNWKQVSTALNCTGAIKTDGTLWMWGYNGTGALGTNDRTGRSSPVQTIAAGTNWKQVSAFEYATGAIKTDGTLWMWGTNVLLGTNTNTSYSSPVQTAAGGNNWKQISVSNASDGNSAAIYFYDADNQYPSA